MSSNTFNNELVNKNKDAICLLSKSVYKNINTNINERNKLHDKLIKKIDLFLGSNNVHDKEKYADDIACMINNPLFDKHNSQLFTKTFRDNAISLLEYNEEVFNPVMKYVIEKDDDTLTNIFLQNGLSYVDKFIFCVNPSLYSHSALIVKFSKPVKLCGSTSDVAGILYSYSIKARTDNSKITFWDKLINRLRQLLSLFWGKKAYMTRILLTSEDLSKLENHKGNNVFDLSYVDGNIIENCIKLSLDSIKPLDNLTKNNVEYLESLNSKLEQVSYYFSLYTKNNTNYLAKDKIVNYYFHDDDVLLELDSNNNGICIYDFILTDCKKLNLTHDKKMSIVGKFLKLECLKLLKETKIINNNATDFSLKDFEKLPKIKPNDLKRKFCYPKTLTLDLDDNLVGYKCLYKLEELNIKPKDYSILNNNCLTVLKEILSECNTLKKLIKYTDKITNWFEIRHPNGYFNKLKGTCSLHCC